MMYGGWEEKCLTFMGLDYNVSRRLGGLCKECVCASPLLVCFLAFCLLPGSPKLCGPAVASLWSALDRCDACEWPLELKTH